MNARFVFHKRTDNPKRNKGTKTKRGGGQGYNPYLTRLKKIVNILSNKDA
jgi:hypothetical protein